MAPGSCASSSHCVFIPVTRKKDAFIHHSAYTALARTVSVHLGKTPRKAALFCTAMCPTKIQGSYIRKKGEPILGDRRQALPQALVGVGAGADQAYGRSFHLPECKAWLRRRERMNEVLDLTGLTF